MYEKPVVIVNEDLAEGVFAASGSTAEPTQNNSNSISISNNTTTADWGNGTGQMTCTVEVPENSDTNLTFVVEFSAPIDSIWGMGGVWVLSSDKQTATCQVWSCKGSQSFTYQGNTSVTVKSVTRVQ